MVMKKDDLIKVMQIAISLLDKGEANKANGVLKIALKVTQYFLHFCKKFCCQELPKIFQSGLMLAVQITALK